MAYDGSIKFDTALNADGVKSGVSTMDKIISTGAKAAVAGIVGITAAFAGVATSALKLGGDLEQSLGGIETMFKNSSGKVVDNAKNAFMTAGLSANDYMEQVTSFSASLLQGLGGDTEKAANIAHMAMVDMSDNANKFGTDIAMIQSAYQGFAKDNYTMLDNLKLGYGGTASEMARLVNESGVLNGEFVATANNVKDIPFDTLILAIHSVQEEMGVTGTTSREAMETLNGSITATKAAWENFLTGVGSSTALVDTVSNTADLIMDRLGEIIPRLAETLPDAIDGIADKAGDIFPSLEPAIGGFSDLITTGMKVATAVLPPLANATGTLLSVTTKLLPVIVGVAAAYKAYSVIGTVTTAFKGFQAVVTATKTVLAASQGAIMANAAAHTLLTAALASETTAELVNTAARKAGMTVDAAGNLITASGAAATMAETAAVLASSGALTAKTLIVGVLSGGISIATAAQWAWNAAMAANPIGLIVAVVILAIAAIAALVVGIIALIGWLKGESEEYQKQKEELENLTKAHEEYEKQLEADKKAADQAIAKTKAQADANNSLVANLRTLIATNDKAGSNNEAIARTVDQLNQSVEGLGLTYDETTGKLSSSIDMVEAYVEAQGELAVIKAQEDEYNRLLSEQLDLQAKIRVEEERQKVLAQQLADKVISEREYNKLIESSNKLLQEYGNTEQQLAVDVQAAHAAIDQAAKDSAQTQINAYEAMNDARDAEGNNIRQLAKIYGTTTEEILAEMAEQGATMAEWSAKKAELFTEEGQSLQGVANQWGLTTDEVIAYMDEWGMSLDEFAEEMENTHTKEGLSLDDLAAKWGTTAEAIKTEMDNMGLSMQEWSDQQQEAWEEYEDAVKERTQGVINSFKEIPGEFEMSATEMLEILQTNKERYAEWEATMEEITRQLGPTAAEEFAKLGPEATSAMQEILGSADLLDEYRETFGVKIDEATGLAVENWNDPSFIGAPSGAIDSSAAMVTENTALDSAVTSTMENAHAAADAVDFTDIGQNISTEIVNGLNSADVTGAMDGVSSGVQSTLSAMSSQSVSITTQMMTQINSAIVSRTGTIKASTTSMGNGVVAAINTMKTQAANLSSQMMTEINSNIVTRTSTVKSSTTALANGVVSALEPMVSGAENVTVRMMDGMMGAMNREASRLYAKAREIANEIAATLAAAWDEHSPSRVSYKIMAFFMQAMYNAMGDMSGMLYREADSIADGLTERLTLSPDVFSGMASRLRSVTDMNPLGGSTLVPAVAGAGAAGGTVFSPTLVQHITTPKPLSPSEMTREGQDALRRQRWQLP